MHTAVHLLRHFGPEWLIFRLRYALRRRSGSLRRLLPVTTWADQSLDTLFADTQLADPERLARTREEYPVPFFFSERDRSQWQPLFAQWDEAATSPVPVADGLTEGVFRLFEHLEINLGRPPNWHLNPVTGEEFPRDRHWTEIEDFAGGDIKLIWEASRFAWVYPLVRAYWRTGHERYPQLFWELLEDWQRANLPQQGVHWKCGQEIALRAMACCFGLFGFSGSPETTPQRLAGLVQMMAVSARRIEANLPYALSQRNNHGISEASGLWTIGLLFPELADSQHWTEIGRQALERQIAELIDEDGAFSQHSANYQRVMLDTCVWALRLGELHDRPLSGSSRERVIRAGEFLWHLQDEATGRMPRYGQNDGALVLPLTGCPAEDYRPAVQSSMALAGKRAYEPGPWDEATVWLFGQQSLEETKQTTIRTDWQGAAGGYQVLRSDSGHVLTRAPRYRHRPAHADALHVDLWWRGQNIALDAGTYSYNAPTPWNNPFAGTLAHNTVSVDVRDQMERAGRFLWLPWLSGERMAYLASPDGQLTYWEGTHDGYQRLPAPVRHHRGVLRIGGEHWLVIDALQSIASHTYRLHWLLQDESYVIDDVQQRITLQTDSGDYHVQMVCGHERGHFSLVRADADSPRGWYAPAYQDRQPALSLALEAVADRVVFATFFGPEAGAVQFGQNSVSATFRDANCSVSLADQSARPGPMLQSVRFEGSGPESCVLIPVTP